jgi:serine/threonine protein kinase
MAFDDITGRIIRGRYKLLDERGRGSFATVYVTRDLSTNLLYAVKVLHMAHSDNVNLIERFKREAHILEKINDPHIVRIVDYGVDNNVYFIVMEYIDGQSLKELYLATGPLQVIRMLDYAHQIAEGLETAHKQGVVHRDIKPQNIHITNKNVAKITDFGLALSVDSQTITRSDEIMGTPYYIAPEQLESAHSADTRADIYSLAAMSFDLLSGRPPFEGNTLLEIAEKHKHDPVPSLSRLRYDIPIELDAVIQKAMAKSPAQRFQTPREFITAIEQVQYLLQPESHPMQARLVLLSSGQVIVLSKEILLIGRRDTKIGFFPDISIDDETKKMGRKHARLCNKRGVYTIEDLNSINGTYLNGEKLPAHEERVLKDGDILRFSHIEARFELRWAPPHFL